MPFQYLEVFSVFVFFLSLFGIITSKSIIKTVLFLLILQTAVITFWITIGRGYHPPIINDPALLRQAQYIADPLPQTLMLTAIIIGVSVVAVIITMLNTIFRSHRQSGWAEMEKEEDDAFKKEIYGSHLHH